MTTRQVAVAWAAHLSAFTLSLYLISVAASNGRDTRVLFVILLVLFFLGNSLLLDRRRRGRTP